MIFLTIFTCIQFVEDAVAAEEMRKVDNAKRLAEIEASEATLSQILTDSKDRGNQAVDSGDVKQIEAVLMSLKVMVYQ